MKHLTKLKLCILTLFALSYVTITGCSIGGQSSPSHFYMLEPLQSISATTNLNNLSMGVGPIRIPGYIDRPQIITKTSTAEIQLADFDRWAEPMGGMVTRTITSNITALTGSNFIQMHPWPPNASFNYQIAANIINLENNEAGDALLIVNWRLINKNDEYGVKTQHSQFHATARDTSYASRVAALNDVLAQFSQEIISQIP